MQTEETLNLRKGQDAQWSKCYDNNKDDISPNNFYTVGKVGASSPNIASMSARMFFFC